MTMYRRSVFAALLGSALAACAQLPPPEAPSQGGVAARDDQSPRFIGVIGVKTQHAPPFLGVPDTNFYCLRSFVDRQTGATQHQLYVSDSYSGPERHWNAVRDDRGRQLRFIEIGQTEITCSGRCSYLEEFAANIPETELRANPRGLTLIFTSGSGDEKQIAVSDSQIAAQLAAIEAKRSPVQPASAASPQSPPPSHQ
jgi:hypothetical protein